MVVECFAAIQGLAGEEVSGSSVHRIEPPDIVPREITETIGFDFEGTLALTASGWTPRQVELLDRFPAPVRDGMLANRSHPRFAFMDEEAWRLVYLLLLEHFRKGDPDWEELLFKLWTVRVLNYTTTAALRGYGYARRYLRAMIGRYLRGAALGS
jgi:mannosylglycerate synthase